LSIEAAVEGRRPSRLAYFLGQNVGLVLALTMLAVAIVVYCAVYWWGQGGLPGNFEITSTVNNTMPLVLTAMGQAFVVIARGLDLSVGGVMDLSNALAAVYIRDNAASMIGWSVLILAIGAALGLANGLLVGVGRLQPILVTLATLSIYQGLAIRVLPQPGGSIPPAYTAALVNPNQPTRSSKCSSSRCCGTRFGEARSGFPSSRSATTSWRRAPTASTRCARG
jgi:ribose transport system permease protein